MAGSFIYKSRAYLLSINQQKKLQFQQATNAMDSPAVTPSIASQPTGTPHDSSATSTPRLPAMQTTPPAVQASLVPSKDSAEFSLAYSSDVTGGTEEAPEKADVASIGEMTDKVTPFPTI
jgi:hypothetical protein